MREKKVMTQTETREGTIEYPSRCRPWNQGNLGVVREMDLYHKVKLRG